MNTQTNIRWIATAALLAVVGLFIFSLFMSRLYGGWWWEALKAFAEAATVGALADWFAVVALFRHPMGLPIPHTAVLVKKQAHIAKSIATFFCENFWVPEQVRERLQSLSPSRFLLQALEQKPGAIGGMRACVVESLSNFLSTEKRRHATAGVLAEVLPALPLKDLVRAFVNGLRRSDFPATAADIFVNEAAGFARKSSGTIADEIVAGVDPTRLLARGTGGGLFGMLGSGVNQVVGDSLKTVLSPLVAGRVRAYADGISGDPNHKLRAELQLAVEQALTDVGTGAKYDAELSRALSSLTSHASVASFLEGALPLLQQSISGSGEETEAQVVERLQRALRDNPEVCAALDEFIADIAASLVAGTADIVAAELENTVRSWDMNTMVSKIEEHVGNDLQYIRLNGTFVGGLIGLVIFAVSSLVALL